jgi:protein-L-isoaspartate(D-aspartate) O-methyltransferase
MGRRDINRAVRRAMEAVPRRHFVPADVVDQADEDRALPIGCGQTISQPYIVGLMTTALGVRAGDRILEVGTGSGYQAAVLAQLGAEVTSLEIVPELDERARAALASAGYDVDVHLADGSHGWPDSAPYDGIIVTAAPDAVPETLLDQLAPGGRLVVPVGPTGAVQDLFVYTKSDDGAIRRRNLAAVRFVPFTGRFATGDR